MEKEIVCKFCNQCFRRHDYRIENKKKYRKGIGPSFCSRNCYDGFIKKEINKQTELSCENCKSDVIRKQSHLKRSKSGNVFCSRSCAAIYNNTHKTTGNRRSKMEVWIEEELKKKYDFEIVFNSKEVINSELDIYIPSLKLAFELNGIFHYEAIYGEEKLKSVINNDNRKFQACLENKIELCIIDASGSKKFKPERDKKYLDIINDVISKRRGLVEKRPIS